MLALPGLYELNLRLSLVGCLIMSPYLVQTASTAEEGRRSITSKSWFLDLRLLGCRFTDPRDHRQVNNLQLAG